MDRLVYTSMTGAAAAADRQSVLANNLANVSTNGFRQELHAFRAVPIKGDGASTRVFAAETASTHDDTPGTITFTDRNLDAMPQGNAYFAVQGLDGTEAYSRNGGFQVNSNGTLVNSVGLQVLSADGAPIDIPQNAQVALGADGTITAKIDGQAINTVGRLKLVTPTQDQPLKRSADGLFRSAAGDQMATDPNARVQTGALEGSNVNAVSTMVAMIEAARQFEQNTKLMQSAEQNDKTASQLLSMN
ncbi:flagellar hook-basal body complex protein [Xylophilus rhododendri]|uniref:Flagellar basal-body rod protein FlgF n=1 Tax=Xylophilus rhododendri TaxID=2697032 RepID=A0A857J569_9BURK|nr:flagellar basal body rod protein FlgF [Xylophilus rhododendri]QHI97985.1 flagellar hook-basal body complex protein [Xylophilus rhododendri]